MRLACGVCATYLLFGWLSWGNAGWLVGLAFGTGVLATWAVMAGAAAWRLGVFRWRVQVKPHSYMEGRVQVVARRLWQEVLLADIKGGADQFDDKLHAAVAEAGPKVAALNAHRRLHP